MPRIRSVKPEFWTDSRMARMSALERLVFLCLWSMADDEGRIEGDALTVWRFGAFREDSREIANALDALRGTQRVRLYEVDGNPYIEVVNFTKHQKIDHAKASKLPAYSSGCDLLSEIVANPREPSRIVAPDQGSGIRDQGSRSRDQGSGKNGAAASPPVDPVKEEVWRTGKAILAEQGMSTDAAGRFLGGLVKDYGQLLVLQAVRDCAETAPAEARSWLVARCQERRATTGGKQAGLEARNAEVARRFLEAGNA